MSTYKDYFENTDDYKIGTGSVDDYMTGTGSLDDYKIGTGSLDDYMSGTGSIDDYKMGTGSIDDYMTGTGSIDDYKIGAYDTDNNENGHEKDNTYSENAVKDEAGQTRTSEEYGMLSKEGGRSGEEELYLKANRLINANCLSAYRSAARIYKSISGYKDSDERYEFCQQKISELKSEDQRVSLNNERVIKKPKEDAKKRSRSIAFIIAAIVMFILMKRVFIQKPKYNQAVSLYEQGRYEEALEKFEDLDGYKDSKRYAAYCKILLIAGGKDYDIDIDDLKLFDPDSDYEEYDDQEYDDEEYDDQEYDDQEYDDQEYDDQEYEDQESDDFDPDDPESEEYGWDESQLYD